MQKVSVRRRRQADSFRYVIEGRSFDVPRARFALVNSNARYRVYTVAGDLLSIEPA